MKVMNATEAKNNFGKAMDVIASQDTVSIEKNGKAAGLLFPDEIGRKLILSGFISGVVPRDQAMKMLGFDWYGDLLDAVKEVGLERKPASEESQREAREYAYNLLKGR